MSNIVGNYFSSGPLTESRALGTMDNRRVVRIR